MKKYRVTFTPDPDLRLRKYSSGGREFTPGRPVFFTEEELTGAIRNDDWLVVEELSPDEQHRLEEAKRCLTQQNW